MKIEKLECDNCHTVEDADAITGWVKAMTIVGDPEGYARLTEAILRGEEPLNTGDFCSLRCLGEWAFAQELLRDLSEEVEPE